MRLERIDEPLFNSYLKPRLISRSAMWTNARSPSTATFGRRDNNFVEGTHHALKQNRLTTRISLWQAVERLQTTFEHILINRQSKQDVANRRFSTVRNRPELDLLCHNLVPRAVEFLTQHLHRNVELSIVIESEGIAVRDGYKTYRVNPRDWKCSCHFAAEYLLPCRHSLRAYLNFDLPIGKSM